MKKYIYNFLMLVFACTALYSGYKIIAIQSGYAAGESTYKNLEKYIREEKVENITATKSEEESRAFESSRHSKDLEVDFGALESVNNEVTGWLYLPDSKINYPVVKGADNEYYLNHLFDGKENSSGSIFMDSKNSDDFSDVHNIIYGHHMKNGSMFTDLTKFKNQDFYESHKTAYFITREKKYEIELFSAYITNVSDEAWDIDFSDEAEVLEWAKETKAKSLFKCEKEPKQGDRYMTLSTCDYDFEDARFVVVGIMR